MHLRRTFILFIALMVVTSGVYAQIYAPAANDSFNAKYGNDKVFVFNRPVYQADIIASIIAVSTDNMANWTFHWAKYDPLSAGYNDIPSSNTGRISAIDTITVFSGYRVRITRGVESDTFRVWILINDLDLNITNKDNADTLLYGYYNCSSLDLRADTIRPRMFYYNPKNQAVIDPDNIYTIRWTTTNPDASIPPSRLLTRVTRPPWKDTWYKITITDGFGLIRSDSVLYNSVQSKAMFKAKYIPLTEDTAAYPGTWIDMFYNTDKHSAPGKYEFDMSDSKNAVAYQLNFGDGDSVIFNHDSLIFVHEYKKPGKYTAVLTTKSAPPFECIDSISIHEDIIYIDYAKNADINIPNVFTPDRDRNSVFKLYEEDPSLVTNDIFRTSDVSVTYVEITIFTRTGLKVHQYEGNIRDWEGWDGYIMNSNRKAPEGVYFYVISRFDAYQDKNDDPVNKKYMNGFIHLYRK